MQKKCRKSVPWGAGESAEKFGKSADLDTPVREIGNEPCGLDTRGQKVLGKQKKQVAQKTSDLDTPGGEMQK